ncbi:MAG: DUF1934 domain-containing protein [Tyzzerella sp.]|nr:DUF1934 domain-containing protein [Tyzzerella sp.]
MTKDVLVSISGLQMAVNEMESNDDEPIEVVSAGTYYLKDGKHYIFFEEVAEGIPGVTKTQIRLTGRETLEVIKKGVSNMHMVFEKGKINRCIYRTPMGELNLGICTSKIVVDEKKDNINIRAEYTLDVNYELLADCTIRINVKPRDSKEFSIHEKMTF